MGTPETERNIANKISRGGFTAAFFVQCLEAIGCQTLRLTEICLGAGGVVAAGGALEGADMVGGVAGRSSIFGMARLKECPDYQGPYYPQHVRASEKSAQAVQLIA